LFNKNKNNTPKLGLKPSIPKLPQLGRGFNSSKDLVFSDDEEDYFSYNKYTGEEEQCGAPSLQLNFNEDNPNRKISKGLTKNISAAKRKAICILNGKEIEKENPNEILGNKKIKNKAAVENKINESLKENETDESSKPKKSKSRLAEVLGEFDVNSEEGKKLLNKKSRNAGALALAEAEREDRYFTTLEKKERMEEKMTSVMEITIAAWACKQCKYLSESRSKLCIEENHPCVKIPKMTKRFYQCKACKMRSSAFNRQLPKPCSKCGDSNFERVSMATERKGPRIGAETLELRGKEQKFILQ